MAYAQNSRVPFQISGFDVCFCLEVHAVQRFQATASYCVHRKPQQ